ncbi:MAG: lipopolysaccharide transport periplasmic protein LptA [Pseudomonadales bacterium]|jgi:lipopolysaccharide export system protein LptA|nr:lipopolysaccharide transport periplasmic protein LptA [Pseudomonadales bacterium]
MRRLLTELRTHPGFTHALTPLFLLLLAPVSLLLTPAALALPEDRLQTLEIEAMSNELFLDRGYFIYRGTAARPAVATQGTMRISGIEIIAERGEDGISKVTATGTPARFQQQPETTQTLIHASGDTLVFDNTAQLVTADGNAEFSQAGNTLKGDHIEYNLQTRRAAATGRDGQPVNMFIPPTPTPPTLTPTPTPAAPTKEE